MKYKLFEVNNEIYFTVDENVKIGDKAIVSMGDMFPTLIECSNDEQIKIIQEPKTSMTKRYKVVEQPEKCEVGKDILDLITETKKGVLVTYENNKLSLLT